MPILFAQVCEMSPELLKFLYQIVIAGLFSWPLENFSSEVQLKPQDQKIIHTINTLVDRNSMLR